MSPEALVPARVSGWWASAGGGRGAQLPTPPLHLSVARKHEQLMSHPALPLPATPSSSLQDDVLQLASMAIQHARGKDASAPAESVALCRGWRADVVGKVLLEKGILEARAWAA